MNTQPQRGNKPGFLSLAIFGIVVFAIIALGILLSEAMGRGGWTFIGLIVGIVVICGVGAWLVAFVTRQYVQWSDARTKSKESERNFIRAMAEAGFLPPNSDWRPVKQITAPPAAQPRDEPPDPRKRLLIDLCLMTIRDPKYGPASRRLMTADDAQAAGKSHGGTFADRNNWDKASKYAQEKHFVFEKRGGTEQGLMVSVNQAGGETVSDLISALMKHDEITDSAVNALPALNR